MSNIVESLPLLSLLLSSILTLFVVFKFRQSSAATGFMFILNGIIPICLVFYLPKILMLIPASVNTQYFHIVTQIIFCLSALQFLTAIHTIRKFIYHETTFISIKEALYSGFICLSLSLLVSLAFINTQNILFRFLSRTEYQYLSLFPLVLVLSAMIIFQLIKLSGKSTGLRTFTIPFLWSILAFDLSLLSTFMAPAQIILKESNLTISILPVIFISQLALFREIKLRISTESVTDGGSKSAENIARKSLWSKFVDIITIKSLKNRKRKVTDTVYEETVKILEFLLSNIPDKKDFIFETGTIEKMKDNPESISIPSVVSLFISLEDYLLTHDQPQVAKKFDKDILTGEIRSRFDTERIPYELKLLLMPPAVQAVHVLEIGLKDLGNFILTNLGKEEMQEIIHSDQFKEFSDDITVTDTGLDFERLNRKIKNENYNPNFIEKLANLFKDLYSRLFVKVEQKYGEKTAKSLVRHTFEKLKESKNEEVAEQLYKALPEKIKEDSAIITITSGILEEKIKDRTQALLDTKKELEKRIIEYENQNKKLENTQKAMLNLVEDSRLLEQELALERDRANTILKTMGEGLVVVNNNYQITTINPLAEELLDITIQEIHKFDLFTLIQIFKGDTKLNKEDDPVAKTIASGEVAKVDLNDNLYFQTRQGRRFPVSVTLTPLKLPNITGVIMVFKDITTDKNTQTTIEKTVELRTRELNEKTNALEKANQKINEGWFMLQQEKARLTASLQNVTMGFIMTNKDLQVEFINKTARDLFTLGPDEEATNFENINKKLYEFHFDLRSKVQSSLYDNKIYDERNMNYLKKVFHLTISPINMEGGITIGTVIIIRDVTETRMLERSRDEFFSIASHELRTPLTAIRGNTSLIQQYYSEQIKDPTLSEMIDDIHKSSLRLIDIVNDFLDTSRLELGKMTFKRDKTDISKLISETINEFQVTGSRKKLLLGFTKNQDLPFVITDKDRTKEVLINLIGNALKFTETGGITVKAVPEGNFMNISVSDTGKGISEENIRLLFRKFQQAENNILTRDATRGTGLGLYISRMMVEGMGGKIWLAKSEIGKGTTFTFTLPIYMETNRNSETV